MNKLAIQSTLWNNTVILILLFYYTYFKDLKFDAENS